MKILPTKSAAERLGLSERTLERHRIAGTGPVFVKLGRSVRYLEADIDAWILARRVRSTSARASDS